MIGKAALTLVLAVALTGCATSLPLSGRESPLRYDPAAVRHADTLVILVPGTLASVDMFAPARSWRAPATALVEYRFPGLDGLPLDHRLGIEHAADQIAELARRYPKKRLRLIGFSTGGAIALLAAERLGGRDVKAALIAPAVERAGGAETALRGAADISLAALRAGSLKKRRIWREYYRTLLFGRKGLRDPEKTARAERFIEREKDRIVLPDRSLTQAQSADLRRWRLPEGFRADPGRVRVYVGLEDPVFSTAQTMRFLRGIGVERITAYPGQGHLLFLTRPDVFGDIRSFFDL